MKYAVTVIITLIVAGAAIFSGVLFLEFKNQGQSDFLDDIVHSKVLGEKRVVNIRLPWDYQFNADETYPLIIKFDGDSRLHRHDQALDILQRTTGTSDAIVVAIPNTIGNRNRDLTPSNWRMDSDGSDTLGEGDKFLEFIETELIPSIEERYRTNGKRVVVGYSRGGLMAVHSLVQKPQVFHGAIALSPAFWRDDGRILSEMDAYLSTSQTTESFLFMSIGSEENAKMRASFSQMEVLLESHAPDTFTWQSMNMQNADHATAPEFAIPHGYVALNEYFMMELSK